jgi:hypothetical protein
MSGAPIGCDDITFTPGVPTPVFGSAWLYV